MEMTESEFKHLKYEIESLMFVLDQKQKEYIDQTGKRYQPPLRLTKWNTLIRDQKKSESG